MIVFDLWMGMTHEYKIKEKMKYCHGNFLEFRSVFMQNYDFRLLHEISFSQEVLHTKAHFQTHWEIMKLKPFIKNLTKMQSLQ